MRPHSPRALRVTSIIHTTTDHMNLNTHIPIIGSIIGDIAGVARGKAIPTAHYLGLRAEVAAMRIRVLLSTMAAMAAMTNRMEMAR